MKDSRIEKLAANLLDYSVDIKAGEKILIEATGSCEPLVRELINGAYSRGAYPFVQLRNQEITRCMLMGAQVEQLEMMKKYDLLRMKDMNAYVAIRGSNNISELADVPVERLINYRKYYQKPIHSEERVKNTKWCVLIYPTSAAAQKARMSTFAFEEFYFNVCNMDYSKMSKAMDPLIELMEKTEQVRLVSKGTDLTFSIKDIPAVKCDGRLNIPDGEVFTAPIRDSVNGTITFNTPSVNQGFIYEDISFTFKDGKIIKAVANDSQRINDVLDVDEGARYIGEFAFGVNPFITFPMMDTLFDEKISGSIHLTPGSTYDECDNGNRSAIHWDLVLIQTPEYGGGEIFFDGKLVRKDGRFTLKELQGLEKGEFK